LTWGARVCHCLGMPTTATTNRAALTRLRVEAGLSQSALAERSGIGRTAITRIESGTRQGSPETIRAIADALGCTVSGPRGHRGEGMTYHDGGIITYVRNGVRHDARRGQGVPQACRTPRGDTVNSTDDIIELADTELAAAAHRVYDAGRVAGWTATDYEAAIDRTRVGSPTWDVLYEARRKLRQFGKVKS
jgi:transcriptional regulator with XRE-family HTH domain